MFVSQPVRFTEAEARAAVVRKWVRQYERERQDV
jgi:hypothetical protein